MLSLNFARKLIDLSIAEWIYKMLFVHWLITFKDIANRVNSDNDLEGQIINSKKHGITWTNFQKKDEVKRLEYQSDL